MDEAGRNQGMRTELRGEGRSREQDHDSSERFGGSGRGNRRGYQGPGRGARHFRNRNFTRSHETPVDVPSEPAVNVPHDSTAAILAAISAREQQYSRGRGRRHDVPNRQSNLQQARRAGGESVEAGMDSDQPSSNSGGSRPVKEGNRRLQDPDRQPSYRRNQKLRGPTNREAPRYGGEQPHLNNTYEGAANERPNNRIQERGPKPSEVPRREQGTELPSKRSTVSRAQRSSTPDKSAVFTKADDATQRERLTEQFTAGKYECMVCCERVRQEHAIWNCSQCFHAFHLGCIKRWARASQDENLQWRCPGCQNFTGGLPNTYLCFCGRQKNPDWNRRETPHSCGEVCSKPLGTALGCTHACNLLCHPGPCPSCCAQINRKCPCGKTSKTVKCGSTDTVTCTENCDKTLACGVHLCSLPCHSGPCPRCEVPVIQHCHCGSSQRRMPCQLLSETEGNTYCCGEVCGKKLNCGNHRCQLVCHVGTCSPCTTQVDQVVSCPCGKYEVEELLGGKKRRQCTDLIPTCGDVCGKSLLCGPAENRHQCGLRCHLGPCPPCQGTTHVKCRCGRSEKEIKCQELLNLGSEPVLCERRCNKKRQCGKHKCINQCCVDGDHICPMICGRQLNCRLHRCEDLCHTGNCKPCLRASFEELYCHCGTQVMYPPIPCGKRPPECDQPCGRPRSCGHAPGHACHPEPPCPPCTVLCEKWCYGGHELRKNVPCHVQEVSCGKPCAKQLPCGRHGCILPCHTGPCPTTCSQPCQTVRAECGHPCGVPCHEGLCPSVSCKEKVKVQCQCGQREATVSCEEQQSAYRKIATGMLASKMAALQNGESVDMKDLLGPTGSGKKDKSKSLECNEDCALVERNRRLALALQIRNPDPKPGAPRYPDLLKDWVKKDARFAQMVHDKLTDVVQLAKQSIGKMRSRSHSFDPMNRDKRQFIHEYCAFFGCESASYDDEPKRNVVVTAFGETSHLPAVGVVEVVQREMGQRKVPAPPSRLQAAGQGSKTVQPASVSQPAPSAWGRASYKTLSDVVKAQPRPVAPAVEVPAPRPQPLIDYFDFTS